MRKQIVNLISSCSCNGSGESLGSCPDRKYGQCGEVTNLSYCVIQNLANHLIANGVTVQRWIPVTERLPEPHSSVLVVVKGKHDFEKEYDIDVDIAEVVEEGGYIDGRFNTWNDWNEGQQFLHVTHWMPLPEAPEDVECC